MEAYLPILIIGGIMALVAIAIIFSVKAERKRREALAALAQNLGLTFSPERDEALRNSLAMFKVFNIGHGRRLKNVMRGAGSDLQFEIFDYRYTTGHGKHSQTHLLTAVHFHLDLVTFPIFSLRAEGFFDRIGAKFGAQDIDFDTHPTFSKKYVLKGDSEDEVRGLFNESVLVLFEQYADQKKRICVEGMGNDLLVYRSGRRIKPEQIQEFYQECQAIFTLMVGASAR